MMAAEIYTLPCISPSYFPPPKDQIVGGRFFFKFTGALLKIKNIGLALPPRQASAPSVKCYIRHCCCTQIVRNLGRQPVCQKLNGFHVFSSRHNIDLSSLPLNFSSNFRHFLQQASTISQIPFASLGERHTQCDSDCFHIMTDAQFGCSYCSQTLWCRRVLIEHGTMGNETKHSQVQRASQLQSITLGVLVSVCLQS